MRFYSTLHQQTTTPNPTPPGTSPPSQGLGEAPSPLSFIPFHYYPKRQLHHSLSSISLKYPLQQVKNIASSSTHHQQTTTPNLTPPGTSPPPEGLGEAALLFFKSLIALFGILILTLIFSLFCFQSVLRQAHPLLRRGLGRLSFHFSNISVHSPTRSQILKI